MSPAPKRIRKRPHPRLCHVEAVLDPGKGVILVGLWNDGSLRWRRLWDGDWVSIAVARVAHAQDEQERSSRP